MKIKTSELTGAALDWATAKAVQIPIYQCGEGWPGNHVVNEESLRRSIVTVGLTGRMLLEGPKTSENKEWSPSTDWAQGGPIIELEKVTLSYDEDGQTYSAHVSLFRQRGMSNRTRWRSGPTPLIAAMRCYVASKLGDEVNVPTELQGEHGDQ